MLLDENAFDSDDNYLHIRGSPFAVECSDPWTEAAALSGSAPAAKDGLRAWGATDGSMKVYVVPEERSEDDEEDDDDDDDEDESSDEEAEPEPEPADEGEEGAPAADGEEGEAAAPAEEKKKEPKPPREPKPRKPPVPAAGVELAIP